MAYGWKFRILVRDLRSVFGGSNKELNAHVVRLSVLYEDLRLELTASGGRRHYKTLESIGKTARQQYFIRRSVATLAEFCDCIRRLNTCSEFDRYKKRLEAAPAALRHWNEAEAFFKTHDGLIKRVRNDIGGHFGEEAARAVVDLLAEEDTALVAQTEFNRDFKNLRGGTKLWFAEELAGQALHRHRGDMSEEEFRNHLFEICQNGYVHAAFCVHAVTHVYLQERFRS